MKIAIIGAGPRGVITAAQLINQFKHRWDGDQQLSITIYDPYGIGGHVWRTDQWAGLIMNTTIDQVTLFNDPSVNLTSPVFDGPSLFEWANSQDAHDFLTANNYSDSVIKVAPMLKAHDYAPRVLYGAYIKWYFQKLIEQLPHNIYVSVKEIEAVGLSIPADNHFTVETPNGSDEYDRVIMSTGQQDNYPSKEIQELANFAKENKLFYLQPTNPGDAKLGDLPAGEPVLIRGLGLSFTDYISELTIGRGGHFIQEENNSLFYQPSGREPKIYAGSKRGIPYYPKALSEKEYGQVTAPSFLTKENIANAKVDGKLPFEKFFDLLKLDMELVYYALLIDDSYPKKQATEFKKAFLATNDHKKVIASFGFNKEDVIDWDYVFNPSKTFRKFPTTNYQTFVVNWLEGINADAFKGSKTGPLSSALELLRDFRSPFRQLIADNVFENSDYVEEFLGRFAPLRNFLSIGTPALRGAELSALIRSGMVTIIAPGMEVTTHNDTFEAKSPNNNDETLRTRYLLEARVPSPDINVTANPILEDMLRKGYIHPKKLMVGDNATQLGAIDVDSDTDQPLDANGNTITSLFIWGVPLEAMRYATTFSPRPGVNDPNLQTADKIAALALGLKPADNVLME